MNAGIQVAIDKMIEKHFDHIDRVDKFISHKSEIKTILNDEYI